MYYLTNFHADYPDAHVIMANCGATVSLSCQIESENSSSSIVREIFLNRIINLLNYYSRHRQCGFVYMKMPILNH
jgi:hypothetical protein